jgi:7-carboxy-7-deazaguanine synthase
VSGIELSICKRIIERHEGSILAESYLEIRSTFIIVLTTKQTQETLKCTIFSNLNSAFYNNYEMIKINEIYLSVQGESSHTGLPCIFVRLTGCNLRCVWCDTSYAFHEGKAQSIDQTLKDVKNFGINLVEITGGEPLMQEDVYPLMEALLDNGYKVMLETGGSLSLGKVPRDVIKILDLKCPGSGEHKKNNLDNLKLLAPHDEVKFVILNRQDYEWSRDLIKKHNINETALILFSPVYGKLELKEMVKWILEDRLPVRLQTQLHKVIWSKETQGV